MQDHVGTTNPLITIHIIYKLIACSFVETTYNFLPSDKPEKTAINYSTSNIQVIQFVTQLDPQNLGGHVNSPSPKKVTA